MSEENYIFKKIENDNYIDFTENLSSVQYTQLIYFTHLQEKFTFSYLNSKIPFDLLKFIDDLLSKYRIIEFKTEFTSLLMFVQDMFCSFKDSYSDDLINDFTDEDKEYKNLFNILELYLFSEINKPQSIAFKFKQKDNKISTIENSIVVEDIFKSILKNLDINKNNFYKKRDQILSQSEHIKHNAGGDYVRVLIVKTLFYFLKSKTSGFSENQLLKFCGCFLHLCQIPYYHKISEIQIDSIESELNSIEPAILRNFIKRPNQLFTK